MIPQRQALIAALEAAVSEKADAAAVQALATGLATVVVEPEAAAADVRLREIRSHVRVLRERAEAACSLLQYRHLAERAGLVADEHVQQFDADAADAAEMASQAAQRVEAISAQIARLQKLGDANAKIVGDAERLVMEQEQAAVQQYTAAVAEGDARTMVAAQKLIAAAQDAASSAGFANRQFRLQGTATAVALAAARDELAKATAAKAGAQKDRAKALAHRRHAIWDKAVNSIVLQIAELRAGDAVDSHEVWMLRGFQNLALPYFDKSRITCCELGLSNDDMACLEWRALDAMTVWFRAECAPAAVKAQATELLQEQLAMAAAEPTTEPATATEAAA